MSAWSLEVRGGIGVLTIDVPGESVNSLGEPAIRELETFLVELEGRQEVRAVVLRSGKPDNFIAGADINQFLTITTAAQGEAMSQAGQGFVDRVERYPKPLVVAIHGSCLGLGLELSLACRYRVATSHPKTVLGLPEVQLGLLPGAGGCNRLPRLIGARAALDIILPGKSERAAKALKLGLIDELVPPSILLDTALAAAERLAAGTQPRRSRPGGISAWLLDRNPLGRQIVYAAAKRQILRKTGTNYPAPLAALDVVRTGLEQGMRRGLAAEARRFGELSVTPVARELIRIFFATTALKRDDGVPAGIRGRQVERLGVVGSGFMGSGIAGTAAAVAHVEARLKDAELARVGKGIAAALKIVDGQLERKRITRFERERLAALISGGIDYRRFEQADLVIEAVFEDVGVKRGVFHELEAVVPSTTVLATNTSTIPIATLVEGATHPERILGMHFFSPVDRMPLLEVIPGAATELEAIATAVRFGKKLGKTVIVVADQPGFWVNRILSTYLAEAAYLLSEGAPIDLVDRTMVRFGFPVGPFALLDEVGIDVAHKAGHVMQAAFGDRLVPSPVLDRMVEDGRLGRKAGKGFYLYHQGHKTDPDPAVYRLVGVTPLATMSTSEIERRLIYAMLNEAGRAAQDGVVRSARDGDIGALFGIGFPPFRGGPLRMMDNLGIPEVVATLRELAQSYGPRFTPAPGLVAMAETEERFYPE
jgi:3-hydroxyacyl-CoA dehydrogenase/enoyl-CoA hydratase/3-hydroxybutyryl-CoA epimerase